MDFLQALEQFDWIGWLVLIALFLVIEMLTLEFTFLMLAVGSVLGLVSGLLGAPVWLQVIIAAVASLILILVLRPALLRRLHRSKDPAKSNVAALIGLHGQVVGTVTRVDGQVKLSNGDVWTARTQASASLPPATPITVTAIEGATAFVTPSPTEEPV